MTVGQELADKASLHHPFTFTKLVLFLLLSRNTQGERLPELAEELEKLRAGLAVAGDQAGNIEKNPDVLDDVGCRAVSICF